MERGPSVQGRSRRGGIGVSEEIADSISRAVDLPKGNSASYSGDHSLASIINNPHVGKSGVYGSDTSWVGWFSSSPANPAESSPIILNKTFPEIARSDFAPYLALISEPYSRFEDIRQHTSRELIDSQRGQGEDNDSVFRGQGASLVACLREVPSLFFKEDFQLEDGGTFRAACPFSSIAETSILQEKLSHYLDVVEMHLVKEISLRSDSFFEAQVQLQDLNGRIVEACGRLQETKGAIKLLENDLVGSAKHVQELNTKRSNLLALQEKLRLILNVNQALSALKLLVTSADCAGALDITDDLQHLLDSDELTGLHCFRHLRDHLAMSLDSINSILAVEFMRSAIHSGKHTDVGKLHQLYASPTMIKEEEVVLDEDEISGFRERLLPIVIGLLKTAKLPAVLRVYRETLIGDMKTAIKNTVASLLPVLVARAVESDLQAGERAVDADGGGSSLANKLRSLSPDNFVILLAAIFKIVQAHLVMAAEVKKVIEWIMGGLDGSYAADSVAAAVASGAAAAAAAEAAQENDIQVDPLLTYSVQRNTAKVNLLLGKTNEIPSQSNMSKHFRADVLRENAEAVFAACDAAHGRWAKLLGVRQQLHPRLRLQEFLSIYNITQEFISATEKIGGRLGYSIRGTLQSQSKAFIDFQHHSRLEKIVAVLDQETWVSVDVPEEFQAISDSFSSGLLANGNLVGDDTSRVVMLTTMKDSISDPHAVQNHSTDTSQKNMDVESSAKSVGGQDGGLEVPITLVHCSDRNSKEHGRPVSQMLLYRGVGYHMVNCGLILLKMLSEYIDISRSLSAHSSEVVHRIVDILKQFNTRTCQLVLGARAMQVSGLKSITAKHLALASQVISFFCSMMPEMRIIFFMKVPDSRKALLSSELDRIAQDYKVHRDEIHAKLVQIMKERLLVHLRSLPQIAEGWNKTDDNDPQPSQFARALTKEVGVLQRVLSRTLHEEDVIGIFRQVAQNFHSQLTEAFSRLDVGTPQARDRLLRDVQHILACIHSLPTSKSNGDGISKGKLDEFLAQRFQSEAGQ